MIHAVSRARQLGWVDPDNIFLVGLGEGGAVVALWGAEVAVNAYAVASWTCTAPPEAPWFEGLRTPLERPVLLLNGHATRWTGRSGWDGLLRRAARRFRASGLGGHRHRGSERLCPGGRPAGADRLPVRAPGAVIAVPRLCQASPQPSLGGVGSGLVTGGPRSSSLLAEDVRLHRHRRRRRSKAGRPGRQGIGVGRSGNSWCGG